MCLANEAWNEVDTTTIQNCWCKAGFLPDTHLSSESCSQLVHFPLCIFSLVTAPGPINPITELMECYNSLLGLRSFPHLVLSCYISFPRIPFLCLPSLSSYSGTPHIHCTCPLTPMLFLALLPDRGIPFAYHFLVMDAYSSSQFSHISCVLLLLILFSMTFHDILFLLSGMFYLVLPCSFAYLLSRSLLEYISPHTCTYSVLLICTIHVLHLFCLESLTPRPNPPLPLVNLVTPELAKLLIISTSLRPTLKDSLLFYLCLPL